MAKKLTFIGWQEVFNDLDLVMPLFQNAWRSSIVPTREEITKENLGEEFDLFAEELFRIQDSGKKIRWGSSSHLL